MIIIHRKNARAYSNWYSYNQFHESELCSCIFILWTRGEGGIKCLRYENNRSTANFAHVVSTADGSVTGSHKRKQAAQHARWEAAPACCWLHCLQLLASTTLYSWRSRAVKVAIFLVISFALGDAGWSFGLKMDATETSDELSSAALRFGYRAPLWIGLHWRLDK